MEDTELLIENTEVTEVNAADEEFTSDEVETEIEMDVVVEGEQSGSTVVDIEAAVYSALETYFEENTLLVSDVGNADGIHKKIVDFSLTEVCLVIIVLILLGGSIFKLIGGRVWNKL